MSARILVVDDEPDLEALVLQKFRQQIRHGTVDFLFAHDGFEALAKLRANGGIDLVVTDINMPRMDGLALLQKLQENDEGILTIIISAYGAMGNIRTAMNRGAFDFVTKPIDFGDLQTTITKSIRHIEYLREARQRQAEADDFSREGYPMCAAAGCANTRTPPPLCSQKILQNQIQFPVCSSIVRYALFNISRDEGSRAIYRIQLSNFWPV